MPPSPISLTPAAPIAPMTCPACDTPVDPEDQFCESCGSPIVPPVPQSPTTLLPHSPIPLPPHSPCTQCGSQSIDTEGFCRHCGFRNSLAAAQNRIQNRQVISHSDRCVALSDRGLRRRLNQDAMAIAQTHQTHSATHWSLTVCDGISSAPRSEDAAQLAAQTICDALAAPPAKVNPECPMPDQQIAVNQDRCSDKPPSNHAVESADYSPLNRLTQSDRISLVQAAIGSAQLAVATLASDVDFTLVNAPATTVVTALVTPIGSNPGHRITLGWLGDSRAYWLSATGSYQLTQDHVGTAAAGEVCHALTHWLGADADPDQQPSVIEFRCPGPGLLLLCSDGLWNYAPEADQLYQILAASPDASPEALAQATRLADFALAQGGHDNITIALLQFPESP